MKRTSIVTVKFGDDRYATAEVTTFAKYDLTRDEQERAHDKAIDRVAEALRDLPYFGFAPLRAVRIK